MRGTSFVFDNLTHAQIGQRALETKKIYSAVSRVTLNGCAHALFVNEKDAEKAKAVLTDRGLHFTVREG